MTDEQIVEMFFANISPSERARLYLFFSGREIVSPADPDQKRRKIRSGDKGPGRKEEDQLKSIGFIYKTATIKP